jgi:hypothetical protein
MNEEQLSVPHAGIVDISGAQVHSNLLITSLQGTNELCHYK